MLLWRLIWKDTIVFLPHQQTLNLSVNVFVLFLHFYFIWFCFTGQRTGQGAERAWQAGFKPMTCSYMLCTQLHHLHLILHIQMVDKLKGKAEWKGGETNADASLKSKRALHKVWWVQNRCELNVVVFRLNRTQPAYFFFILLVFIAAALTKYVLLPSVCIQFIWFLTKTLFECSFDFSPICAPQSISTFTLINAKKKNPACVDDI